MLFDYDSFFNWDKPAYSFSRSVHDMYPYQLKNFDDKVVLAHSVVGIKPDDVIVSVEGDPKSDRNQLVIEGLTHNDILDYDYKVKSKFDFKANLFKNIDYTVEDGIVYITLYKKEPEAEQLVVKRITK